MTKADGIVWIFLAIAGLAILGIVALTCFEIITERRQRRRLAEAGDEDLSIDTRLVRLESELATLSGEFSRSGLADYPGGPLTVAESADGHERQVRPPER